jgi:hypothetical protein
VSVSSEIICENKMNTVVTTTNSLMSITDILSCMADIIRVTLNNITYMPVKLMIPRRPYESFISRFMYGDMVDIHYIRDADWDIGSG